MKHWKRALATASVAIVTSGVGIAIGGVAAAGTCPTRTTSTPFTAWGDSNSYFVAPAGTFESGATGWTFYGNIGVVADQAPWKVNGSNHSKALNLPAYATAMPPNMCVASNEDAVRMFYKDPGVSGASLLVKIEAWNAAGTNGRVITQSTIRSSGAGWKLSPRIAMPNNRDAAGEQWVTVTFTPINTAGTWRIDDVMIDPWIAR